MEDNNLKKEIFTSINHFSKSDLFDSTKKLFEALGYSTDRSASLPQATYKSFKDSFIQNDSKFNEDKALANNWLSVDLLFQLTKEEILKQTSLFDTGKFNNTIIESYLFMAVELDNKLEYSRTNLSNITREINKLFAMPVMVLFKTGALITLAVINRRLNKKDESKDVLEKVTLIKDINILNPHRAHVEILFDLSFEQLISNHIITNFAELHNAWQNTLDTKELNKKFFNELANWYFWAIQNVAFPDDTEKDKELRNATNVIRLITRITFVWFLKEKKLVPDELFDETKLKELLNYTDKKKSTYYKAILQNLFFATLNTEMGKRKFRTLSDGKSQNAHYFIHNLFRYENEFIKPKETLEKYFASIPFLNGGLFECLDKQIEVKDKLKSLRIDGFSDREDNILKVPDELFFGSEKEVDLNSTYGTKNKKYKVKGLINILNSYKFTITENTPIEEEIALDPELLGKVFENLLANYNEETKTTARKQTGSFYTPREIVNYMVDESLIAYYKEQLKGDDDFEIKLRDLLSYSVNIPSFSKKEKELLIQATDTIKILDPACGSGAYPMGVLQKLVHILHKLDPKNELWKQRQIDKAEQIDDADSRDAAIETIEEAFENNELDYGRKLYLIENCIYGVDLQPVAVQISKLRFFISLIVDQKTTINKENLGVRPLPNLETKFVAANTLIGIEKPKESTGDLFNVNKEKIDLKKEQLRKIRHSYFEARTPKKKEQCREKDKQIREDLTKLLSVENMPKTTAELLASWNPYDQNASSLFFDREWMFGLAEGFDIVIGNPPYISYYSNTGSQLTENEKKHFLANYSSVLKANDRINSMNLMTEMGLQNLKLNAHLSFITNKTIAVLPSYKHVRKTILDKSKIDYLITDLSPFDAIVDCVVFGLTKTKEMKEDYEIKWLKGQLENGDLKAVSSILSNSNYEFHFSTNQKIIDFIEKAPYTLEDILIVNRGVNIGGCFDEFLSKKKLNSNYRKYLPGTRNIDKYSYVWEEEDGYLQLDLKKEEVLKANGANIALGNPERYNVPRLFIPESAQSLIAAYCDEKYYSGYGIMVGTLANDNYPIKYACALLNSNLITYYAIEKEILRKGNKATPHVGVKGLKAIPIYCPTIDVTNKFVTIVDYILLSNQSESTIHISMFFERVLNLMVYEMYLSEVIKSSSIDILKHLNNLPIIKEGQEEKNLKIIEKVFAEFSDTSHSISIALDKLDAIPEIRIIEGKA